MLHAAPALHIFPSALARDAALSELDDAAWTDRHLTFSELQARLETLLPGASGRREIGAVARQALLLHALKQDFEAAECERLGGTDAALSASAALLAAWKGAGLRPDDGFAAARRMGDADAKQTTLLLSRLYAAYEKLLGDAWTDREGAEQALLARLESCQRLPERLLAAGAALEAHGFHRLIPFQRRLLSRIAALGHPLSIHAPFTQAENDGGLATLRESFGALAGCVHAPATGKPPEIVRVEAPTPYAEVYEIGRRIRAWIVTDKVPPAAICAAFRDLGPYSQALHDVFTRFGIPFYERRGEPAAFQPLVRVALSAVQACAGGLMREDLFRFLCAGPVELKGLAGARPGMDPSRLHALALDARIERFFGAEAQAPGAAWKARLERYSKGKSEHVAQAAEALGLIVGRLEGMRIARTPREHAEAWLVLFQDAGLTARRLAKRGNRAAFRGSDETRDALALAALDAALEAVAQAPLDSSVRISLDEFARLLNLAILEQSVRAEGGEPGGVRVLNLYDLRGLRFERVALGGMAEGILPAIAAGDPLLGARGSFALRHALSAPARDKAALCHLQPRLPQECEDEELALFQCARGAAPRLLLTRPCAGFDGTLLGPSIFWNAGVQDSSAAEAPVERAAHIHPAPPLAACLTEEETELRSAWVLGGGATAAGPPDAAETRAAIAEYLASPRLQSSARRAAIEVSRQEFFAGKALTRGESGAVPRPDSPRRSEPGPYNGVLSGTAPEAQQRLAALLLDSPVGGGAALSPSSLEKLAACPFHFMNESVFKFGAPELPGPELSNLERGNVWHVLLAQFYEAELAEARAAGRCVARLETGRRDIYLRKLKSLADKLVAGVPERHFVGHPGLWALARENIGGALAAWVDHELALTARDGFSPAMIEFAFDGRPARDGRPPSDAPLRIPIQHQSHAASTLLLGGRMDRLDFLLEDPAAARPRLTGLRVIDYKLGRGGSYAPNVKIERMQALLSAQLPIYIKAAVEHVARLEKEGKLDVDWDALWKNSRAGYYSLRDVPQSMEDGALVLVESWPLGDLRAFLAGAPGAQPAPLDKEHATLFELVRGKVLDVLQGRFAVDPEACGGTHCTARFACRYQAVPSEGEEGAGKGDGA